MGMRVALYARVSTDGQTTENQLRELEATAALRGWDVVSRFVDEGISGAKGRDQRPAFDRLHKAMTRREIDIVMVWAVDRLGRSLQHLVGFLSELQAANVDLYLHQQGLDTSTPAGRAMFQMLGVFSEFERSLIQSRVKAGMARARAEGKRFGRPPLKPTKAAAIRAELQAGGKGILRIAKELGVGTGTVQRIKAEMARVAQP
ncbi:MAG: recombinase family protein [Alphaproteobacteria bacterium]|nr:recombinase family protein [Alphaproteobacteria bacterium]